MRWSGWRNACARLMRRAEESELRHGAFLKSWFALPGGMPASSNRRRRGLGAKPPAAVLTIIGAESQRIQNHSLPQPFSFRTQQISGYASRTREHDGRAARFRRIG